MLGRTKMSSTGHIRDWNAVVRQVPGSLVMKAVMHHRYELELHSFRHVEPMKVDIGWKAASRSDQDQTFSYHYEDMSTGVCLI